MQGEQRAGGSVGRVEWQAPDNRKQTRPGNSWLGWWHCPTKHMAVWLPCLTPVAGPELPGTPEE